MLTKGAIGNLVNRYKAVLKKCNLINTFGSLAVASMLVLGGAGVAVADTYSNTVKAGEGKAETIEVAGDVTFNKGIWVSNGGSVEINADNVTIEKFSKSGMYPSIYHEDAGNVAINCGNDVIINGSIYTYASGEEIYSTTTINAKNITLNLTDYYGISNGASGTITLNASKDLTITKSSGYAVEQYTNTAKKNQNILLTADGNTKIDGGIANYSYGDINVYFNGSESYLKGDLDGYYNSAIANYGDGDINAFFNGAGSYLNGNISNFYNYDDTNGDINVDFNGANSYLEGDIVNNGPGNINVNFNGTGAYFTGSSEVSGTGATNITLNGATWNVTKDSKVTTLSLTDGATVNNEAKLTIDGSATLGSSITGENGEVELSGADVTVTSADAKIEGVVTTNDNTAITATGEVNDALGGDASALLTQLNIEEGTVTMAEGLLMGEASATADANGVTVSAAKPSTTVETTLDLASAMPLAINRILMNDIRKRMGDLRTNPSEYGAWARYEGGKIKGEGLTNNFSTIQVGADKAIGDSFRLGAAFSYTYSDIDQANGGSEGDAFIFSGYGLWMGQNGMFADVIARVGHNDTDMTVQNFKTSTDAMTYSLSGEFGWRFDLPMSFYVEPQAELTYTYVDGDKFSLSSVNFDVEETHSLIGRVGLLAGWKFCDRGDAYVRASVLQEFDGDAKVTGSLGRTTVVDETDGKDTWFEYGIGANFKLTDKAYIWADVERTEGAIMDEEWRGTVGFRYSF